MAKKKSNKKSSKTKKEAKKKKASNKKTEEKKKKASNKKTEEKKVKKESKKPKQKKAKKETKEKTSKSETSASKAEATEVQQFTFDPRKFITILAWGLLLVLSLVLVDYFVQYLNNDYSAAVIKGDNFVARVPKSDVMDRVETLVDETALGANLTRTFIDDRIIRLEAEEEGVNVSEEEIDEVFDGNVEQYPGDEEEFVEFLKAEQALTEELYRDQIEKNLLAQKLVVDEPSDDELKEFYEQYKDVYQFSEDNFEDAKDEVEDTYYNQQLSSELPKWLENKKEELDIQNNLSLDEEVQKETEYGFLKTTRTLVSDLWDNVNSKDKE